MDLNRSIPHCVCDESCTGGGVGGEAPNITDVTIQIFFSFFFK